MNKLLLISILAFLICPNCEEIIWSSNTKLNWSNFRGDVPVDKGLKTAVTYVQIKIKGEFVDGVIPSVKVVASFMPEKSWTIVRDSATLMHEQLHFDIAELYARKIRKEFKELNNNKVLDYESYKQKYFEIIKEHKRIQAEYDSNVYFNDEKQQEWIMDVASALKELKQYEYISQ